MIQSEPRPAREIIVRLVKAEEKMSRPSILERVVELLGIAVLLGGFILSLGWSYAFAWFQAWKMPLAALSISSEHLFEYGRLALIANLWMIVLAILVFAACLLGGRSYQSVFKGAVPFIIVAALLVSWFGAHWMGKRAALLDFARLVAGDYQSLPIAEINLKPDIEIPPDFARDLAPGSPCYRLLYTSPEAIWIARTRDNNWDPLVAMIPNDHVVSIRLYPRQGNCRAGQK